MSEATPATSVQRARQAAARGEWQHAHELLAEADAHLRLSGPDLSFLADMAYASGRLDVTIDAWERVHAQSVRDGDQLSAAAAAVRVAMHLLLDTALMAPVRGWTKHAEELLVGHAETPVHAWLAVVRNYERLLSGDFQSARQWARQAIDIGTKCAPAAAAIGRVAEARCLILEGEVQQGLELLNKAAVTAVSGDLDALSKGLVYCELVCAMQAVAQYDLAEEWTQAMESWRHGQPVGSIHGRCRVHRAEILRLRGSFPEAEKEALIACEELRPYLRRELGWPLTELGRIRLRRGNIQGAEEAFMAAHEVGWDPQPGLALVYLARGDIALAARSIEDALNHPSTVPSKELPPNTELSRAPLLEAQVEIQIAAGKPDLARAAADELSRIAALFESKALLASAALAHGRLRLARGDAAGARRHLEIAAQLWSEVGAPYETALARMGLAHAYRDEGNEERATLEFQAARSGFARIGAVDQATEAARACRELGPASLAQQESLPHAALATATRDTNVLRREGDYWLVAFEGQTVRLRDLKGVRYLARLLAEPGREFHVVDLVVLESGSFGDASRSGESGLPFASDFVAGMPLDAQAKQAYARRLAEIDADIAEAYALEDHARAAQAEDEREFLVRELSRAVGLGGRDRRLGSASERARASVTRALRHAMARIRAHLPALGEHLDRAVRTGTYCAYLPDPRLPMVWHR